MAEPKTTLDIAGDEDLVNRIWSKVAEQRKLWQAEAKTLAKFMLLVRHRNLEEDVPLCAEALYYVKHRKPMPASLKAQIERERQDAEEARREAENILRKKEEETKPKKAPPRRRSSSSSSSSRSSSPSRHSTPDRKKAKRGKETRRSSSESWEKRREQHSKNGREEGRKGDDKYDRKGDDKYDRRGDDKYDRRGDDKHDRKRDDKYDRRGDDKYDRRGDDKYDRRGDDKHDRKGDDKYDRRGDDKYDRRGDDKYDRRGDDKHDRKGEDKYDRKGEDKYDRKGDDKHDRRRDDKYDRREDDRYSHSDTGSSDMQAKKREAAERTEGSESKRARKAEAAGAPAPPPSLPPQSLKISISATRKPSAADKPSHRNVFGEDESSEEKEEEPSKGKQLPPEVVLRKPAGQEKAESEPVSHGNQLMKQREAKRVKELIASIPNDKDGLYNYEIDWDKVDEATYKTLRPWLVKKVKEIIGEEEVDFAEYIIAKVKARELPESIEKDLQDVLDSDTRKFVMQLWRYIIFETLSRKA